MDARKRTRSDPQVSPEILEQIALWFKILAEPMRLRILHSLQTGERTVTEIIDATAAPARPTSPNTSASSRAPTWSRAARKA